MTTTQQIWQKQFNQVSEAIPDNWTTTLEDGLVYILPEYGNEPLIRTYWRLVQVGAWNGWM